MRVSAAIWLVVGFIFCLGQLPMSAKGNGNGRPSFSTKGATGGSYGAFIESLRAELRAKSNITSRGITVLNPSLSGSQQFVEVDLTANENGVAANITLAIDAVNVYVVAYRSCNNSYFLSDAPRSASNILFPATNITTLGFNGSYPSLENVVGKNRGNFSLGLNSLSQAIFTLSKTSSSKSEVAKGLIVAIQMSSEAARFRFIERRMRFYIKYSQDKPPDAEILELETSWSALSGQIQSVPEGRLAFNREVEVQDKNNSRIKVGTLLSPYVANVALLLYTCDLPKTIRMPLQLPVRDDDLVALEDGSHNKACSNAQPTTWISGRDGLCVDIKNGGTKDGDPVQISSCGKSNQNWTFYSDRTIRPSVNKCMVASHTSSGANVVINDCSNKTTSNLKTWTSSMDGTFKNSGSGFVLTAGASDTTTAEGTQLTVIANRDTTYQGWNVGSQVDPFETNIVGYDDLCLAGNRGGVVWIEGCDVNNKEQKWALYNDGTIRVASNSSRCMTTPATSTNSPITIATCGISPNQRWVLTTDAKFLNPNANLVMEVKNSNPSLKEIILSAPKEGKASQEWLPFLII